MPAQIRFRGVALFVMGGSGVGQDGRLHVLFPRTIGGEDRENQPNAVLRPALHHPLLSLFRQDGESLSTGVRIGGQDLRIRADTNLVNDLPAGLFSLRRCVGPAFVPATPLSVANGRAAVTVTVGGGGLSMGNGPDNHRWSLAPATSGGDAQAEVRMREVVWTAPDDEPVAIEGDSGALAVVGPGEMAVIGNFDTPQAARSPRITASSLVDFDIDFEWLYALLTPDPPARPVPQLVKGGPGFLSAASTKDSTDANDPTKVSPMTSTCFGGSWP